MKRGVRFLVLLIILNILPFVFAANCDPLTENFDGSCDYEGGTGDQIAEYCAGSSCNAELINSLTPAQQEQFWNKPGMVTDHHDKLNPTNIKYVDTSNANVAATIIKQRQDLIKHGTMSTTQIRQLADSSSISLANMGNPEIWEAFHKALPDDEKIELWGDLKPSQRHDVTINFFLDLLGLSFPTYDTDGTLIPGEDIDLSDVSSDSLTDMLRTTEGGGYDILIEYPPGTEVSMVNGKLVIAGSEIDLNQLKSGSHHIKLDEHKLMLDNKVYAYTSSIETYLQTILFLEGTFEMEDIEAADVNYTYIYADNKVEGDFAQVLSISNVYLPDGTKQFVGISTQSLEGFSILPDGTMISEHADSLSIQFMNMEITDIVNFTLKPDGTLLNQYAAQVELVDSEDHHSIYTDLDLLSLVTEDATGMTIIGSNAFIESASRVLITRKDTTTGDILIAIIEDALGLKIYADGTYKFDNATIIRDDYKDVVLDNVTGGKLDTLGNYYADHVDSFQFGNKYLTDVTNLEYLPDQLKFVYDTNGILISIAPTDYTIKTDEASRIKILDLELQDILESELTIVGNVIVKGNVTSGDENNSFQIHFPTDINLTLDSNQSAFWDSRVQPFSLKLQGLVKAGFLNLGYFIAYEPEGNLLAWFELDHVDYEINNGLLVIDKISPILDDMMSCPNNQTCKVNVSYNYGFTCGEFAQGASYQYNHTELDKSFKEISQKQAYTICTKKYPAQSFPAWDILNDIPSKSTTILGNMTYEKFLDKKMAPVYHGITDNNATLKFSSNLHKIEDIKIEKHGIKSITTHGNFEIIEENSSRFVKVNRSLISAKAIKHYETFNYTSTIKITDRLYQDNGDSFIAIYEPGKGDQEIQRVKDYV